MRPISSVALAFLASTANPLILATASPLSERQQDDTISVRTRVSLHPAQVDVLQDADYAFWSVDEESSSSFGINGLNFTLSTGDEAVALQGDWHKFVYRKALPSLGERLVGTGISTHEDSDGGAVTLTIVGLPEGEHSLLTWHNSFVKGDEFAQISISVDGSEAASDISQSSEVNNIWDAATSYITFATGESGTVEVTFTPSGADNRVYLNGFEIDGPDIGYQVGFPEPENKHEHIEVEGGSITASWRTPRDAESATYDIYLGTDPDSLESVASGVSETQVELSGLNTQDTFYWRVDVTADGKHYPGRAFMFRLAQLAFPGAEGYGRFSRGGRGGKVVHVTTLEDGEQEGTLRWALTGVTGPRTVVFDVGGVITTTSRLSVNSAYVTVAGQTAPGKGIAVQGHPLGLTGAQDVVFRHVRVRPGTISGETIDGMGMQGSNYCIFDRCSMGWAIDECFSSRSAHNITFQRSMISEPLNVAGHQNYPEGTAHGYSATIGGDIGSFHHNLLAHAEGRSWSMGGGADDNGAFAGQLDIRNNVVYNFGTRVTDGGAHKVDFVGNYYKPGPSSEQTFALEATYEDGLPGTQQYHCAGNSMLGIFDQESEQYPPGDGTSQSENIACYAKVSIDPPPDYQAFFDEPFFESHVETQTSTEAYKRVLSDSGASQPTLDNHDRRIIQETLNGTTTYTGSESGKKGLIDSPDDAGGLEDFPAVTRSASWDANGDGIADWWDGSTGGEGYTVLDGYLNFMAESHAFVEPSGSVTVNLAALAAGFEGPSFAVSEASLGTVSVDGSEATFKASGEAGVDRLKITIKDGEGTWTRPFGVAVFEGADDAQ